MLFRPAHLPAEFDPRAEYLVAQAMTWKAKSLRRGDPFPLEKNPDQDLVQRYRDLTKTSFIIAASHPLAPERLEQPPAYSSKHVGGGRYRILDVRGEVIEELGTFTKDEAASKLEELSGAPKISNEEAAKLKELLGSSETGGSGAGEIVVKPSADLTHTGGPDTDLNV